MHDSRYSFKIKLSLTDLHLATSIWYFLYLSVRNRITRTLTQAMFPICFQFGNKKICI
jgi:hypothetical protein